MRVIRYHNKKTAVYGILTSEGIVHQAIGSIELGFKQGERIGLLNDLKLLAPVVPSKIVAIGRNYKAHVEEFNRAMPTEPPLFLKPPSAIIASGETILLPPESNQIHHEAELVLVIGKRCRNVQRADARSVIFGYTCANDVTARDLQQKDVQWTRGKGFDTFCPIGPWIETDIEPRNKKIECCVDGEIRQQSNTDLMIFPIEELIRYVSRIMTLEAGDVILTGTPDGVGELNDGEIVEVTIEGIGTLRNYARIE